MRLLTAFAALAMLLAMLGIYGVLTDFVTQHTREIGVRLALGAGRRDIFALVLRRGLALAASFALARLLRGLLFEVGAADPMTYVIVAVLLLVVAVLACALPARRATKVDPLIALRTE
jgi:ABC-type antimicrobial peptide transport system permease subunit